MNLMDFLFFHYISLTSQAYSKLEAYILITNSFYPEGFMGTKSKTKGQTSLHVETEKIKTIKKMDAGLMNLINKTSVFRLILRSGEISRSEIAQATGLTPPTIIRIIEELMHKKLIISSGQEISSGGRPSIKIKINNEENLVMGIDLGATLIRGCLVDLSGNIRCEIQIPTEIAKGYRAVIDKLITLIDKLRQRGHSDWKIWGIGIGIAGLINTHTGVLEYSPDFNWTKVNLREDLEGKIDLPFFYDNSTRLMAKAELDLGKSLDNQNFVVINAGYGIAAGLVLNGNLLKGNQGFAGEFGHIPIDPESGIQCKCGKIGCLEALASGRRIAEHGKQLFRENPQSLIGKISNGSAENITAKLVAEAATKGDQVAKIVFGEAIENLCKGIGTLTSLLNPSKIYIGGGLSESYGLLFGLIDKKKQKYLLNNNVEILPTTFGDLSTVMGAIALVYDRILEIS